MLDRTLVALHRIHHEWVTVKQPHHGQNCFVSDFQEQYDTVNLVERDEVFTRKRRKSLQKRSVYLPFDLELQDLRFFRPNCL